MLQQLFDGLGLPQGCFEEWLMHLQSNKRGFRHTSNHFSGSFLNRLGSSSVMIPNLSRHDEAVAQATPLLTFVSVLPW